MVSAHAVIRPRTFTVTTIYPEQGLILLGTLYYFYIFNLPTPAWVYCISRLLNKRIVPTHSLVSS